MTDRLRRLLQVVAWAAFLVSAPLLIVSALGHRIRPFSPQAQSVGTFLFRTFPRDASITINTSLQRETTPTAVRSLPSGTYTVRLEKTGYRPWEKRLDILGTRITDVRQVRLYPVTLEEEILVNDVSRAFLSPDERSALLIDTEEEAVLIRLRPDGTEEARLVTSFTLPRNRQLEATWSPDSQWITLDVRGGRQPVFHFLFAASGEHTTFDGQTTFLGWFGQEGHTAVIERGNAIFLRTPPGTDDVPVAAQQLHADASPHGLAVLEAPRTEASQGTLTLFSAITRNRRVLPLPPTPVGPIEHLSLSPRGDVLLQGPHASMLWSAAEEHWTSLPISGERIVWSPDGGKIVWQSSEFDLWTMNIQDDRSTLPLLKPELLLRVSAPIRQVTWFPDSQHVLFLERDVIRVAEIDGRDGHRVESLVGTNRGDAVFTPSASGTLIYTNAQRDGRDVFIRAHLRTLDDR